MTIKLMIPSWWHHSDLHKLTHEGAESKHTGPEAGYEAIGVDGVGEATLDGGLVRVREAYQSL